MNFTKTFRALAQEYEKQLIGNTSYEYSLSVIRSATDAIGWVRRFTPSPERRSNPLGAPTVDLESRERIRTVLLRAISALLVELDSLEAGEVSPREPKR